MSKRKLRSLVVVGALSLLTLAAVARAEVAQKGNARISFQGELSPKALPRSTEAPVSVSVGAKISSVSATKPPPVLQQMSIAINRYGKFDTTGLPVCQLNDIQPATTSDALAVCRRSLVGEGTFSANVPLSGRSPFPSEGKLYAFNGESNGQPAILAHVYGVRPAPASFTLVFLMSHSKGTFGTTLSVKLPKVGSEGGYITGISLNLSKQFSSHGQKRSYLSASCPAPKGLSKAGFSFAKASFGFAGGQKLTSTLERTCKVRGS
jgi:hypothetical protein